MGAGAYFCRPSLARFRQDNRSVTGGRAGAWIGDSAAVKFIPKFLEQVLLQRGPLVWRDSAIGLDHLRKLVIRKCPCDGADGLAEFSLIPRSMFGLFLSGDRPSDAVVEVQELLHGRHGGHLS